MRISTVFKICSLSMLMAVASFARPINDGNKLFAAGDYAGALEKYMKAREAEPANPLFVLQHWNVPVQARQF